MFMKKNIIIFSFLILISVVFSGCSKENEKKVYYFDKEGNMTTEKPKEEKITADKLEVYYFHRTARCYSCNTAGEYVSETITEYFSDQVKNGIIDFREINVDLSENKEIARKFQATGSSLFINKIVNGKDNIEQDANIWRLLNSEARFKDYLKNKIESYLATTP